MEARDQLFKRHVAQTSPDPLYIKISSARGVWITDDAGRRYLDFVAGISVSNLGHGHPAVTEAIKRQADDYLHLMVYGEFDQAPQTAYAVSLAARLPASLSKVYFVTSGSEAVEGALKAARRYTGRYETITFRNAYHGGTAGAMSVMGHDRFTRAYRPLVPGVRMIDFNDFSALEMITRRTACVIVEPVQGEAGVILPAPGYLEALRQRCDETGALLLYDEVQTGFGRLGDLFAFMKYGVAPDILILAKALGGGLPLGAFIASPEIMDTLSHHPSLGHITTFGGHPLSCAAGLAAWEYLLSSDLLSTLPRKEEIIRQKMKHPLIKETRGTGLLFAIDMTRPELLDKTVRRALEKGVISDWFLFREEAFRISPPLTITEEELEKGCDILLETLDEVRNDER
jgi:acetylornithine/succinyldiaminopimelate/putrescine aminotransferase